MLEQLNRWRYYWRTSALGSLEILPLWMMLLAHLITSIGFCFNMSCQAWVLPLSFFIILLGAGFVSLYRALCFVLLVAGVLLLTFFTYSYTGVDGVDYHYPMQRLLIEGWNPILQSTIPQFQALSIEGYIKAVHTLFLPRGGAVCGALVALSTGLFTGDAFLGYLFVFVLWRVSLRFAVMQWACSLRMGCVFALALTGTTKITNLIAGQMDFVLYAGFMVAVFAFLTWRKSGVLGDLCMAMLGLIFAMLSKTTGTYYGSVALLVSLFVAGKFATYRLMFLLFAGLMLLLGATPFLTSWVHYSSPLYPLISWSQAIPAVDITSDFIANADGEQMGYLARMIYAWVSPSLAIKGCAWWYGNPAFSPEFYVHGGVAGMAPFFRVMLMAGILALMFSRKNAVFWLCILLVFTSNAVPLKYVGYARYYPQLWAFPFLAAFNLLYAPYPFLAQWMKYVKSLTGVGVVLFMTTFLLRTVAFFATEFSLEAERQQRLTSMAKISSEWYSEETLPYTFIQRMRASGMSLTTDTRAPHFTLNKAKCLPVSASISSQSTFAESLPLCNSPKALLDYPWIKAFSRSPLPVFRDD